MERELANEVHVFCGRIGFKFYDRTPEPGSSIGELIGVPPEGVYITEKVEEAKWDDSINKPNETVTARYMDGTNKVTTIMVTSAEMDELLRRLDEAERNRIDGKLRIDLRIREKEAEKISAKDLAYLSIKNKINKSEMENWQTFLNKNLEGKNERNQTQGE